MAIQQTGNGASPATAPYAEPKQAPKNEAKTPASNKAAKEAPEETKAAAKTAFGDAPKGSNTNEGTGNAKNSDGAKNADAPKNTDVPKEPNSGTGQEAKVPADGKASAAPKAPAEGKSQDDPKAPADGKSSDAPKAPADGKASADQPAPPASASNNPAPKLNLPLNPENPNSKLPEPAPPTDPKVGSPELISTIDPEVDKALNTKLGSGKTVAEEVSAKTMEDLKKHAELLKLANAPDDAVSKYFKWKKAESMLKQGIATGPDPKDPTLPAEPGTIGESSTYDILDAQKIADGIKAAEADPIVQAWISKQQVYNLEHVLDEKIKTGEIADVPKDAGTGLRSDYLKDKQITFLQNPDIVKAIAKMPSDKQNEAISKAILPFAELGTTPQQSKKELFDLVYDVAKLSGAPLPVADANYNPIKTANGETILQDQRSGQGIAIGKDGKALTDENNGLQTAFNLDGSQTVTVNGESVQVDTSGNAVVIKDGIKHVYDAKSNDLLKNPDTGNKIVVDPNTNATVEQDAKTGVLVKEAKTGLPYVVDLQTGKALTNPNTGNSIVAHTETGAPVEVDKATGKIVADKEGNVVVVDPKTGYQVWDKNNNPVVMDKDTKMPFVADPKTGLKHIMNPQTGTPLLDPKDGFLAILDPESKLPAAVVVNNETGEIIKNPNGKMAQLDETSGLPVLVDAKTGDKTIVDASTGYAVQDPKGNTLYVDKNTGLAVAKDANGKHVVDWRSQAKLIYDGKTGVPIGSDETGTVLGIDPKTNLPVEVDFATYGTYTKDENRNAVVMDPTTGKQMMTTDGKGIVIDKKAFLPVATIDGKNIVVNPYTGAYVKDTDTGIKVMIDPVSNSPVYQDPTTGEPFKDPMTGGLQLVDPKTGDSLQDVFGNAIQINPNTGAPGLWDPETKSFKETAPLPVPLTDADGNTVLSSGGQIVAKDGATGHTILLDPNTKQPIDGPKVGMPQLVHSDGSKVMDGKANYVVQDKDTGKPVAVDVYGNLIVDPKGNALLHTQEGTQVADANGNPVVLDKESGAPIITDKATGAPLVDGAGNVYVANPLTGGAVVDSATGDTVVLDKESKAPVLAAADGTVYKDAGGNLYLADTETGKAKMDVYANYIMVDKNVGMPLIVDPKTGIKTLVDGMGNVMKDPKSGGTYEVGKNGLPQIVIDNEDGTKAVMDPQTGKQMEINGNLVFIDAKTGQPVINDPLLGTIDVVTGKAPVDAVNGAPTAYSEFADKIWKAIRAGVGGTYWTTFGVVGAPFSKYKDNDFFTKSAKNFHASRMVASASGVVTMVMAGFRWAKDSPMYDKLKEGDPKAILSFAEDLSAVMKYFGFYPKTVDGFVKYFAGDVAKVGKHGVQLAGDNKTIYRPNPGKGTVDIFVAKNQINPFTGEKVSAHTWVEAPPGTFSVTQGVINPPAAAPGTKHGDVRPVAPDPANPAAALQYEKWNANTGKWENVGTNPNNLPTDVANPNHYTPEQGVPTKGTSDAESDAGSSSSGKKSSTNATYTPSDPPTHPTAYAKYAAHKLVKIVGKVANFLMGAGNFIGGALQLYKGGDQIAEAISGKNIVKGVAGAFNVIGGVAYAVTGVAGMAAAIGMAVNAAIPGVGLAIGNIATLVAIIVDSYSNPEATKPQKEQWANKVLAELEGIDAYQPDAKKKLEEWFAKFALGYWYEKDQSKIKEEFPDTSPKGEGAKYGPKWGGGR